MCTMQQIWVKLASHRMVCSVIYKNSDISLVRLSITSQKGLLWTMCKVHKNCRGWASTGRTWHAATVSSRWSSSPPASARQRRIFSIDPSRCRGQGIPRHHAPASHVGRWHRHLPRSPSPPIHRVRDLVDIAIAVAPSRATSPRIPHPRLPRPLCRDGVGIWSGTSLVAGARPSPRSDGALVQCALHERWRQMEKRIV